jgi:hypothetical protein
MLSRHRSRPVDGELFRRASSSARSDAAPRCSRSGAGTAAALVAGGDCLPGSHPAYSEDPASRFHAEALEVYETVNTLTSEQETIAPFWSDDPGATATPPGHSLAIATQVLRREGASLAAAAETYAKVGIAVRDAFVACWHQKFVYNLLRPVTYLRRLDPDWLLESVEIRGSSDALGLLCQSDSTSSESW